MAHTAVVTGGSGFIATELVKQLLAKGYKVRATVRNANDDNKVGHLLRLSEALPGSLELFEADLLKPGSFDAAVSGVDYVFHTASPFLVGKFDNPQAQLVDPALKGTRNVLSSVVKNKATVKRVVLTSSFAACRSMGKPAAPVSGDLYSEKDWNEGSTLEDEPYMLSKTLAERAAWEVAKENGLDLVVINPVFVIGPVTSARTDASSIQDMKARLEGAVKPGLRFCDVRDVARAHVLAAEVPTAQGRYIVSHHSITANREISDILKKRLPGLDIPDGDEPQTKPMIDNSKVQKELDLGLTPVAESLMDMAVTLIELGVAQPKFK